ncbi:MAG TPA: chemotaxis protein CheW [Nitrospiraceae bacterium]|nr:chemotaxis protein CheW [Nitrospiraceae bacterium]
MTQTEGIVHHVTAERAESAKAATRPMRVCLLSLAGQSFVIDLRYVREVFEVTTITPVPGAPAMLCGVANLRGVVMPIADLRPALGLPVWKTSARYAVVIQQGVQQIGVLVDKVPELRDLLPDEYVTAAVQSPEGAHPFVTSILKLAGRMGSVIEVPALLSYIGGTNK